MWSHDDMATDWLWVPRDLALKSSLRRWWTLGDLRAFEDPPLGIEPGEYLTRFHGGCISSATIVSFLYPTTPKSVFRSFVKNKAPAETSHGDVARTRKDKSSLGVLLLAFGKRYFSRAFHQQDQRGPEPTRWPVGKIQCAWPRFSPI